MLTLMEQFEGQAAWRRERAGVYPNDKRNLEAAVIFDRMAATAEAVPAELLTAYEELFDEFSDSEAAQQMLREVGFSRWPNDAAELIRAFIAERTGG